jgi:hypothetical protein
MRLPDPECAFYFAALAQLDPQMRPIFAQRVVQCLGAHPDPGPGDVDRAIREALVGLWTPPPDEEKRSLPRWSQRADRRDGWSSGARKRVVPAA